MFCLFWLSSAALCDSIAEIVTEHKKSTPRNLLPAPDQSGQSRAGKMGPSCPLGWPIRTQDYHMATRGYEFYFRALIGSLTVYSEPVKDIISTKRQIHIHMQTCHVLLVKINENFNKHRSM